MAWIRQLPKPKDGPALWAATVYLPSGERVTESRELKGQIEKWARDLESSFDRGQWIDPRGAKIEVRELWERYASKRRQAKNSRQRDRSHWKVYVEPRWADWPCGSVLKPDIDVWIAGLEEDRVGAASIQAAVGVLRAVLDAAVDARLIAFNVAKQVKCTPRDAHLDRVLDDDEAHLLLDNADRRFPGRPDAQLLLDLMLNCGLRYEEATALDREHVNTRSRLIHVGPVMEKDGTIKPHGKSRAATRPVPVDDDLWPRLRARAMATKPGGMLITMPRGGNMLYDSWRDRMYLKCLAEARPMTGAEVEAWKDARRAEGLRAWKRLWIVETPLFADPQPTAHDLRHTYGTRLGEAGVPAHEIMALMGHDTLESVQRYLHARDGRFEKARQATMSLRRRPSTLH